MDPGLTRHATERNEATVAMRHSQYESVLFEFRLNGTYRAVFGKLEDQKYQVHNGPHNQEADSPSCSGANDRGSPEGGLPELHRDQHQRADREHHQPMLRIEGGQLEHVPRPGIEQKSDLQHR